MEEENNNIDYSKIVAAQNAEARRLKIVKLERDTSNEKRRKNIAAIAYGVGFAGMIAAVIAAEITTGNINDSMQQVISNLANSNLVPPFITSAVVGAVGFFENLRHSRKYRENKDELDDMSISSPEHYLDEVESMGRHR